MFDSGGSPAPEPGNYFEEALAARQRCANMISDLNRQQAEMKAQVLAGKMQDPSKAVQQLDDLYNAGVEAAHEERLAIIACVNLWREVRAQRAREKIAEQAKMVPLSIDAGRGSAMSMSDAGRGSAMSRGSALSDGPPLVPQALVPGPSTDLGSTPLVESSAPWSGPPGNEPGAAPGNWPTGV